MEAPVKEKKIYELNADAKFKFRTYVLLQAMIQDQICFGVPLQGEDKILSDQLDFMFHNGLISAETKFGSPVYAPTEKGRQYLEAFFKKYFEFLKIFDVFCAVDFETGEFAFSKFYDMTDETWPSYIRQERFQDVRVAVSEFKKIDPVEIVFMSFLNEDKFNLDNWKTYTMSDEPWNEIVNICNTAIPLSDLADAGVIEDIVNKGNAVMKELIEVERKRDLALDSIPEETVTETITTTEIIEDDDFYVPVIEPPIFGIGYWDPYYADPYYMSPFWYDPIVFIY